MLEAKDASFDPMQADWPARLAQQVLTQLRADAASKVTGSTQQEKRTTLANVAPNWAELLFPHESLRGHQERDKGNRQERARAGTYLTDLAAALTNKWQQVGTSSISFRTVRPLIVPAQPMQAGAQTEILFATDRQFASAAGARLLHLVLLDRGANYELKSPTHKRYVACISYDTKTEAYVSKSNYTPAPDECPSQPQHVVVAVDLEDLDHSEIFVNQIIKALKPDNLKRLTVSSETWQSRALKLSTADMLLKKTDKQLDSLFEQHSAASIATLKEYAQRYSVALIARKLAKTEYDISTTPVDTAAARRAKDISLVTGDDLTNLQNVLNTIYSEYLLENKPDADTPVAGVAKVQRVVQVQREQEYGNASATLGDWFYPDAVRCVIEDGNLEEILVSGHLANGQATSYETYAPIGISSDNDLRRQWPRQLLYAHHSTDKTFIRLTDVLDYAPIIEANGKDRSPADGTYILHPGDGLRARSLPRLTKARILQGRIYSDLVGLSGDRPNGLLQLEISRKFNWGTPWSKWSHRFQWRGPAYIQPLVALTKAEQANRYLPLTRGRDAAHKDTLYTVRAIDLLRYTTFRVGLDANLFSIRIASMKSDYSLDGSIYLNRVDIKSIRTSKSANADSSLNVAMYGLSLKARFRPDSRFGVDYRAGLYRYVLLNDRDEASHTRIQQQPTVTDFQPDGHTSLAKYWHEAVVQLEILGWVSLTPNSKLFARPQFSFVRQQPTQSYFQFQVGYQIDIFGGSRENTTPVNSLWPAAKTTTSTSTTTPQP